jgi:rRNA-processing protein FCF1
MILIDRPIITDANVLIDFYETGKEIFKILKEEVKLYVPLLVLNEVSQLSLDEAERLGIILIDSCFELINEAESLKNGLSFPDNVCLLTALKENYICVTNDRKLKKECLNYGVKTIWELELIIFINERGRISKQQALNVVQAITKINNRITTDIIKDFESRLK